MRNGVTIRRIIYSLDLLFITIVIIICVSRDGACRLIINFGSCRSVLLLVLITCDNFVTLSIRIRTILIVAS